MAYYTKSPRTRIRDEELDSFFDDRGIAHPYEPWKTERWEERREAIIGDECDRCGSENDLQVHHENTRPNWRSLWDDVRDELFFDMEYQPAMYDPLGLVCPECHTQSKYRGRVTKTPTWTCNNCSWTGEELLPFPRTDAEIESLWNDVNDFVKENRGEITEVFADRFEEQWERYFTTDDVVTLCREHHKKTHDREQ